MQEPAISNANSSIEQLEKKAFYDQLRGILAAVAQNGYEPYRPWAAVELDRVSKILEGCES